MSIIGYAVVNSEGLHWNHRTEHKVLTLHTALNEFIEATKAAPDHGFTLTPIKENEIAEPIFENQELHLVDQLRRSLSGLTHLSLNNDKTRYQVNLVNHLNAEITTNEDARVCIEAYEVGYDDQFVKTFTFNELLEAAQNGTLTLDTSIESRIELFNPDKPITIPTERNGLLSVLDHVWYIDNKNDGNKVTRYDCLPIIKRLLELHPQMKNQILWDVVIDSLKTCKMFEHYTGDDHDDATENAERASTKYKETTLEVFCNADNNRLPKPMHQSFTADLAIALIQNTESLKEQLHTLYNSDAHPESKSPLEAVKLV